MSGGVGRSRGERKRRKIDVRSMQMTVKRRSTHESNTLHCFERVSRECRETVEHVDFGFPVDTSTLIE